MVDVVLASLAVVDADHAPDQGDHVLFNQRSLFRRCFVAELAVQLVAANPPEVVLAWVKEQALDKRLCVFNARWLTRS